MCVFPPVGFKGNLSLLELFRLFPGNLSKWREKTNTYGTYLDCPGRVSHFAAEPPTSPTQVDREVALRREAERRLESAGPDIPANGLRLCPKSHRTPLGWIFRLELLGFLFIFPFNQPKVELVAGGSTAPKLKGSWFGLPKRQKGPITRKWWSPKEISPQVNSTHVCDFPGGFFVCKWWLFLAESGSTWHVRCF